MLSFVPDSRFLGTGNRSGVLCLAGLYGFSHAGAGSCGF